MAPFRNKDRGLFVFLLDLNFSPMQAKQAAEKG